MPHRGPGIIDGHLLRWRVRINLGQDPATGNTRYHYKSIHGPKKDAQAYFDWYTGLMATGETPVETVSQTELKQLGDLELRVAQFKEKLLAKVDSGAKVQPGPLNLVCP